MAEMSISDRLLQALQHRSTTEPVLPRHRQALTETIRLHQARKAGSPKGLPDPRFMTGANAFPLALEALRNKDFLYSPAHYKQLTRANRVGADPRILEFADKMVKRCAGLLIPIYPHTIVRTYDDQMSAVVRGVSRDWPDVGLWPHRFAAVDLVHGTLQWMDKPAIPHAWDVIGHLGKEVAHSMGIKITWGGDFTRLYDPAHWELTGWRDMLPPDERPLKAVKVGALPPGMTVER